MARRRHLTPEEADLWRTVAQTARPALTSVRQDIVALGEAAAELMIAQLRGEEVEPRILKSELVIRETA